MATSRRTKSATPWRPAAPFDSSSSRAESTTLSYDASKDMHLPKDYRLRVRTAREKNTLKDDYARAADKVTHQMVRDKQQTAAVKSRSLMRRYAGSAKLYSRTWDIWPNEAAYYPTSTGAGGADMNAIQRSMSVNKPSVSVPCASVMSPHSKDYVDALRSASQPSTPKAGSISGLSTSNSLAQLASERRLNPLIPTSSKRNLSGIGVRRQRPHTSQPSAYNAAITGQVLYSARPTTAAATGKTAGKTTRIDFTSGAWLRSGPGQACFDTSIYMPAPATRHSLAAHAMSNNFTQPYTDSGIVDI
eukprot:jgi/Tetstr1/426843/TSEL_017058.t1